MGAQHALDLVDKFLIWTNCMKAKPSKCRSLCLTKKASGAQSYVHFDGRLHIGQHSIQSIAENPFKFLGRFISYNLSDRDQRAELVQKFEQYMDTVDQVPLKGASKVWIFNHYIMSYIAWPLIIYEFPPSVISELTRSTNRFLKRWLQVYRAASPETFYLPEAGLNI